MPQDVELGGLLLRKGYFPMIALLRDFSHDEAGLILSAELVIILTIAVLGMVVGLVNIQSALIGEFADLGLAFQSLNQSYSTPSYRGCWKWWGGRTSWVAGSYFIDIFDGCVGTNYVANNGCEITSGSAYYLPSGSGQVINGPVTDAVVVPSTIVQPTPQGTTLPVPATGTCPTCP